MHSLDEMVEEIARHQGVELPESMAEDQDDGDKPMSKSARVRQYLEEHPEARNKDVAEALAPHGVRPADVANAKAQMKRKAAKEAPAKAAATPKSVASKPAETAAEPTIDATIQLDLLEAGMEFIRKAGGVNEAQHVLNIVRRIRSLS